LCNLLEKQQGTHDGFGAPGVAGAPTWGMPDDAPDTLRVRRSWTSLSDDEKRAVLDAFLALKQVTVSSGDPGSPRADYTSLCDELELDGYEKNLYDYYVEAHTNAFLSMGTPYQTMAQMSHMGPQFLPWHRYLLLRLEADIREVTGDPDFAMPYWDWTDCWEDGDASSCDPIFEEDFLGGPGSCDEADNDVSGYLTDNGFRVHLTTVWGDSPFKTDAILCETRKLKREVGCSDLVSGPPDADAIDGIFDRAVYDDEPNNACDTDEDVSFRQYLEGYDNDDKVLTCVAAGCEMHSRGHIFIGGDMFHSSGSPNDPMFFLHHANVDRMWAAWQQANLSTGRDEDAEDYGNPGYPEDYRGSLFVWSQLRAEDLFDYEALGYTYDTLPEP
ncbi:MAG: tyrosinase family protein, partial [Phycisphaerales bacterium]|nr:tyrosinase family protein [Phycisphaerales bacterium]